MIEPLTPPTSSGIRTASQSIFANAVQCSRLKATSFCWRFFLSSRSRQ